MSIPYRKWSVAVDEIAPTKGLSVKGAALLSGTGSIDITAVPPAKSVGKLSPLGALIRKSSPGNGGPASEPLKESALSKSETEVNVPVVTGVPSMTAQPSYAHPAGNVGKSSAAPGPAAGSRNQIPLFSLFIPPRLLLLQLYRT